MNLIDIPTKVTVRLATEDRRNLKHALETGLVPGYNPTTADTFRIALMRMVAAANPPDAKRRRSAEGRR